MNQVGDNGESEHESMKKKKSGEEGGLRGSVFAFQPPEARGAVNRDCLRPGCPFHQGTSGSSLRVR